MSSEASPIRSWLYAPGNRERMLERVVGFGADAVVLDLEDAVPLGEKSHARRSVADAIGRYSQVRSPLVFVRVNHRTTGLQEDDLSAVVQSGLSGVRLPKVESAADVREASALLDALEDSRGLTIGRIFLVCTVETARGVWNAAEIASASDRVLALAFGAVDFGRDIGASPGPERLETLHARSHLVLASRVAGVRPPVDGVHVDLEDDEGLARSTREAKELGFFGRSAIHPRQVPAINDAFTPSAEEIRRAQDVVDAARTAADIGSGTLRLATGEFVDAAVVRRAEDILHLASALSKVVAL